jgi:predicted metal-binding membrane protein
MSMMWMHTPGQSWAGAAAGFLAMWMAMMAAMMLPSLASMLRRYRRAIAGAGAARRESLTMLVAAGYWLVWAGVGIAACAAGALLAAATMRYATLAQAVSAATGVAVVLGGLVQFTRWKGRHLECCRTMPAWPCTLAARPGVALRHGVRLGLHCNACCAGFTVALLAVGVMDLRAMAFASVALLAERFLPRGERVARVTGVVLVGTGFVLATMG